METFLSKREIFDKVKKHLLAQRERSSIIVNVPFVSERCLYRHSEGLMCAVGCLIGDNAYSKELESHVINTKNVLNALQKSNINTYDDGIIAMLAALQSLHDGQDPSDWFEELNKLEQEVFGDATIVPEIVLDAD